MSSARLRNRERNRRLLLTEIDWRTYSRLLRAFEECPSVRLTYDRGNLEIMSPFPEHESDADFLGRLAVTLTEELDLPIKAGRSTTYRRRRKHKGLEPDNSYWIHNEPKVRGKRRIDLRVDPPPDLCMEVDGTHSSLDRFAIYAALKVPEIWHLEKGILTIHCLTAEGKYQEGPSQIFPGLCGSDLVPFLNLRATLDENAVIRAFRAWVRSRFKNP